MLRLFLGSSFMKGFRMVQMSREPHWSRLIASESSRRNIAAGAHCMLIDGSELAHGSTKDKNVTLELTVASAQGAMTKLKQSADFIAHHLKDNSIQAVIIKGYLSDDMVEAFVHGGIAVCHGLDQSSFEYASSITSRHPWSPLQPISMQINPAQAFSTSSSIRPLCFSGCLGD